MPGLKVEYWYHGKPGKRWRLTENGRTISTHASKEAAMKAGKERMKKWKR